MLLQCIDPAMASTGDDNDTIWGEIAMQLRRSVNSTKKKYMRYVRDRLISDIVRVISNIESLISSNSLRSLLLRLIIFSFLSKL
jgi:hypothetical protein